MPFIDDCMEAPSGCDLLQVTQWWAVEPGFFPAPEFLATDAPYHLLNVGFYVGPTRKVLGPPLMDLMLMILKKESVKGAEASQPNLRPASGSSWAPVSWQRQSRGWSKHAVPFDRKYYRRQCREQGEKGGLGGGLQDVRSNVRQSSGSWQAGE